MNENISLKPTDFIKHAGLYIWDDIILKTYNYPTITLNTFRVDEPFEFQMGIVTEFGRQI